MKALLMNKQILLALGMIVFAGAVLTYNTGAFFTSSATATANVFQAGTLNLLISKISATTGFGTTVSAPWNFSALVPGGAAQTSSVWLKNSGSVNGMHLGINAANTIDDSHDTINPHANLAPKLRITSLMLGSTNLLQGGATADLSSYVAPTNCTVTLSGSDTLTSALATAQNGDVLCLTGSDYSTAWEGAPVNINKSVTIAAVNGPASQKISAGLIVNVPNVTIEGFTLVPASFLGEISAVYLNTGDQSGTVITSNDIDGTGIAGATRGIVVATGGTDTSVSITNNEIHNLTTGIYTNPHTGMITVNHNSIHNDVSGIGGFTNVDAEYNTFADNSSESIGTDSTYQGGTIAYNNFTNGIGVHDYGTTSGTPAQNNWWGDTTPANHVAGTVNTTNFATAPVDGQLINGTDYNHNGYADLDDLAHTQLLSAATLNAGQVRQLVMSVQLDGSADNNYQGAGLNTDLTFTLTQQ